MEPPQVEAYQQKKGQLQQTIEQRRQQIEQLKAQRKAIPKHIEIKDLPEQDRFQRLRAEKKHLRLHLMGTQAHDRVVHHICAAPTATETVFPGTDLRLIYEISGSPLIPSDLDV
jgi:hypothetical protein